MPLADLSLHLRFSGGSGTAEGEMKHGLVCLFCIETLAPSHSVYIVFLIISVYSTIVNIHFRCINQKE